MKFMTDVDLAKYKSLYLKTAGDNLLKLRDNLELLKTDPENKKAAFEMFRLFHSLKSQNFFMGFEKTARLCKIFEDFFRRINAGENKFNPDKITLVTDTLTDLEKSIVEINRNNSEIDFTREIINLENKLI